MRLSSPVEAVAYEDSILAAIAKENGFENDRGIAEILLTLNHINRLTSLTRISVFSIFLNIEIY